MSSNIKHKKRKRLLLIVAITIALLVIIRLILPFMVLHYSNKKLASMKGYYGHIDDIDLALIRGAYKINRVYLDKQDTTSLKQTPFFAAESIDLSIEWRALLRGSLVGKVKFDSPLLVFTKDKVEPSALQKDSSSFITLVDDFMPLYINRVEVFKGVIRYKDEGSKPVVDIEMTDTYILAQNLRNSYDSSSLLPASVNASAHIYEGSLQFNMKLNPLQKTPIFDMSAELKNTNLVKLNDFFQAYGKFDVNKGKFGLYVEAATKEGQITGYVKPFIEDLDVLGKEDREDNILRKAWEGLVGGAGQVFRNQSADQFASKIPFEGNIENPNANIWYAIISIMQNAFIRALQPAIDHEINIETIDDPKHKKKTFLQDLFDGKNDEATKRKR